MIIFDISHLSFIYLFFPFSGGNSFVFYLKDAKLTYFHFDVENITNVDLYINTWHGVESSRLIPFS